MDSSNDPELRIQALKQPLWIGYGRAVALRQQMEELFNHPRMHRMPNLAVIGESNNGKSMLLNNFARRHDPTLAPGYSVNDDKIERPVFLFQAPPEPDEGRLYNRMLTELYAPGSEREPAESKLRRVSVILKALNTRMVLIDEFGFFQAGTPMKQRKLLNALKFLGNELQIPIVVAAVPETLNLLQSDPQVANRFEPVFLPKWKMGEDFQKLLATMEKTLGLRLPSNLAAESSAQRILDESNGIIGYMSELLQKLAIDAIRSGAESVTLNALKEANLKRLGWVHPSRRHRYAG
ncbi:TniB family NTP-binding protein [Variovorax sp. ZS18.2.2]|uniref:TniB family NTP-binding protein n=1 Tax=Variovorax sp. ZS18.2.2 TaxID=2971255 RepID=UPI0021519D05|nr:TniB family NTP-binding protein [Variovorax sp. ZS18.2.2]MCR6480419.1 TniB family NTP-binding protein [Variovorax sp. ZS18.2.2]